MSSRNKKIGTYDVTNFSIREMTECGRVLRSIGKYDSSMAEVADRIVRHLYNGLVDMEGNRACRLVRFYKTHPYGELDEELQVFALTKLGGYPAFHDMKCLVLLATAGDEADWNSPETSRNHKVIPLPGEEAIRQAPMIMSLITQLGIDISSVLKTDPRFIPDMERLTYNVFYVRGALGSPSIPAQEEFVVPYGIKSVAGFGGLLPGGDMFAVSMFFRVTVPEEAVDLFKILSLNVKVAVLPFETAVFSNTARL
jgi:hypothetical protein